jgi:hypothetical protein
MTRSTHAELEADGAQHGQRCRDGGEELQRGHGRSVGFFPGADKHAQYSLSRLFENVAWRLITPSLGGAASLTVQGLLN